MLLTAAALPDPSPLSGAGAGAAVLPCSWMPNDLKGLPQEGSRLRPGTWRPETDFAINAISDIIDCMASITIRKLPENTKRRLRIRAARNGRSMEQEARDLLEASLAQPDPEPVNIGEAIRRRFAPLGGVDLKIPPRRISVRDNPFK